MFFTNNWGVKIDGEFLSNLRFADDIFLYTETPQELQQMLQELSDESRQMGLKVKDPVAYFFRKILYDDYTKLLLIILSS